MSVKAKRIAPWELRPGEPAFAPESYDWHLLAEGDSWFSFGSFFGNSLLDGMTFSRKTLITQTAMPGDTLSRMADWDRDANFRSLLTRTPPYEQDFDAILLSGGGNDLIDAAGKQYNGTAILKICDPGMTQPQDCIHAAGWDLLEDYLRKSFRRIADAAALHHPGTPVFVHTYDYATPRPAGAGFGKGPWLEPSFQHHQVPPALWVPLADLLQQKLAHVIRTLGLGNVHVVDTLGTLARAAPGSPGRSHDWLNEIHPTEEGYELLGAKWAAKIESVI
jgi:lysophospholipase L1-like esterase